MLDGQSLASSMLRFVKPTQSINIEALDCSKAHIATATSSQFKTEGGVGINKLADIAFEDGGKEGREDEWGEKRNVDDDSEEENADDKDADTEAVENEEVCSYDVLYSDIFDGLCLFQTN